LRHDLPFDEPDDLMSIRARRNGRSWGAMLGTGGIPAKWTGPPHDTLRSGIAGYDPIAISACARRSLEIALA